MATIDADLKIDMVQLQKMGTGKLFGPGSSVQESLTYIQEWYKLNKQK